MPVILYKKKGGGGVGRVFPFASIANQPHSLYNKYVPGSGVGATTISNRRALLRHARQQLTTIPSAPTITAIASGNNTLTVSFTAGNNGGSEITNYAYSTNDGNTWQDCNPPDTTSPIVITSLTNGTTYNVRIKAKNNNGYSPQSNMEPGTPSTSPSAPTITTITSGNNTLTVSFTAGNNNGESIDNYAYSTNDGNTWQDCNPADTTSPIVITSLTNDITYNVRIKAKNNNGYSPQSNMISGTPVAVVITPPTLVYALSGNEESYIYFTAGSGTIQNYEYTMDEGITYSSFNPSITTSPVHITGLTNNVSKTIKLRSITASGNSIWSNSISVTPTNQSVPTEWLYYDPNNSSSYSGSGTVVNNLGSFGTMTGTKQGGVTWQDGTGSIGRKVFNFSGNDSTSYIGFSSIDFTSNFTISAWVYPTEKFSINGILANVIGGPNTQGFKVGWNTWQTTDKIMFAETGGPSEWKIPSTVSNVVINGVWQYLTYSIDIPNTRAIFYRNGIPMSTSNLTIAANTVKSGPFNVGSYYGATNYSMKAELGMLKVFNSTLDAWQVLTDYNNTKSLFI
jgi:hypothetical protein